MAVAPTSQHTFIKHEATKLSSFPSLNQVARLVDKDRGVDIIHLDFAEPPGTALHKGNIGKYGLDVGTFMWLHDRLKGHQAMTSVHRSVIAKSVSHWVMVQK